VSKLKNCISIAMSKCDENIKHLFISSKYPNASRETDWFLWGSKSVWPINNNQRGVYIFKFNGVVFYVGQGQIYSRITQTLSKFKKLFVEYGNRKAPKIKKGEDWTVANKLFNLNNRANKWSVKCIIFDTGNISLDKQYAKHAEDQVIIDYDLRASGINEKVGDVT